MRTITAIILLVLCGTATAQNRIASGSTYHTIEPQNVMAYSFWTSCVFWATCSQNPSNNPVWTVQSFDSGRRDATQATASLRPSFTTPVLKFDGVDDYLNVSAYVNGIEQYAAGGVAMWVKQVGTVGGSWSVGPGTKDSFAGILTRHNAACLGYVRRYNGATPTFDNQFTFGAIPSNAWTHVLFQSSGSTYTVYTNGVAAALSFDLGSNNGEWFKAIDDLSDCTTWLIGANQGISSPSLAWFHNGYMDDVIVFNRLLSALEVTNLYNATKSPTPARP